MPLTRYYLAWKYAVHVRKPLLCARLVKNAFLVGVLRRPLLRYVEFALDFACNLKCEHCFTPALVPAEPREPLRPADYRTIARECRKLGALSFSFQGGEPFLFLDKLEAAIRACEPRRALISVTTNGTLCSRENIDRLWRLGVDILTISIDSGVAAEHDAFRGEAGTHTKAMQAVDLALARGLRVTIGATVSHANVRSEGLQLLMAAARRKRCLLMLALAAPAGRWQGQDALLLTPADIELIAQYTRRNPFVRTDLEGNYRHHGCGAMKEIVYITPYGDLLACPFLHIAFGHVPDEPVAAIRERALRLPWLARYWPRCLTGGDMAFRRDVLAQLQAHGQGLVDATLIPKLEAWTDDSANIQEAIEPKHS